MKMKIEEILKTKEYRERIIKYFRLPIRLSVSEEKFKSDLEYIQETDPTFYEEMKQMVESDFNELILEQSTETPDFTFESILNPIVEEFRETKQWQEFLKKDFSEEIKKCEGASSVSGFYKPDNSGKCFLSIDLVSANWQTLQNILGFKESYEELISKYTDKKIPLTSKTIRTKITGLLSAKEIMVYNKYLLLSKKDGILLKLKEETGLDFTSETPVAFYADEFILEISQEQALKLLSLDLSELSKKVEEVGIKVHIRPFFMKKLGLEKGYVKFHKVGYEIIGLSKDALMILNKIHNQVEIKEVDFEKISLGKRTKEEYLLEVEARLKTLIQEDAKWRKSQAELN